MAASDKDIHQKEQALRYCVTNGLVPFLEVNVINVRELTEKPTFLTDIDALGIHLSRTGIRRTIFDCKTANKTSPINRAFWAAGLVRYTNSSEAFVILQKSALEAHRLSAKALNVHLFDEVLFKSYSAASIGTTHVNNDSYISSIDIWLRLHAAYKSNTALAPLEDFLRHAVPLEDDFAKSFRGVLGLLKQVRGELDPKKPHHNAIYCHAIFSAAYALTPVVNDFFDLFDPKQSKEDFEGFLRSYIWGGRESYRLRRRLREMMAALNENVSAEVELNNWDDFIEMFRGFLDSPKDLSLCCIPLMELSLRCVADVDHQSDGAAGRRLNGSNRIRQFIFRLSGYLMKSAGLPKEFDENLRSNINFLMAVPK